MLSGIAFYPSLGYNLVRNYVQPQKWAWYNRVDETLIVGAMPFKSMAQELIEKENVGGVVCCTESFEVKAAYKSMGKEEWEELGVKYHAVPMTDFVGSTGRAEVDNAVHFVEDVAKEGKTIYVHCKAGRTRSATIATCYLMKSRNWLPNVAFHFLKASRPQVLLRNAHWRTCNEYRRFLDHQSSSSISSSS